jgi:hypothetical protein
VQLFATYPVTTAQDEPPAVRVGSLLLRARSARCTCRRVPTRRAVLDRPQDLPIQFGVASEHLHASVANSEKPERSILIPDSRPAQHNTMGWRGHSYTTTWAVDQALPNSPAFPIIYLRSAVISAAQRCNNWGQRSVARAIQSNLQTETPWRPDLTSAKIVRWSAWYKR